MKQYFAAALLTLAMSMTAFADIIPNESEPQTKSANAQQVRRQLERIGVSSTEALTITEKLSQDQIQFLAKSETSNTYVGALLPEEWLGAALWFYCTVPYIEKNIRKYIMNDSFTPNEFFGWRPFDFD